MAFKSSESSVQSTTKKFLIDKDNKSFYGSVRNECSSCRAFDANIVKFRVR